MRIDEAALDKYISYLSSKTASHSVARAQRQEGFTKDIASLTEFPGMSPIYLKPWLNRTVLGPNLGRLAPVMSVCI